MTRLDLKRKILGKYNRIEDFANEIGYGRQHISNIIRNKAVGKVEFWEQVRQKLNMTYQEIWECMTYENIKRGKHNEKRNQ